MVGCGPLVPCGVVPCGEVTCGVVTCGCRLYLGTMGFVGSHFGELRHLHPVNRTVPTPTKNQVVMVLLKGDGYHDICGLSLGGNPVGDEGTVLGDNYQP